MPRFPNLLAPVLALTAVVPAVSASGQSASPAPAFGGAAALDEKSLGTIAGREDTHQAAAANLVAGVSQNSVGDNVRTGDAKVSDNAFQNLSGLSILNINTGNNVAINAAMNVNIAIQPRP